MAHHKKNPTPAGTPGAGLVENEAGSPFLALNPISFGLQREVLALARRGIAPGLVATIAELASFGGMP